MLTKGLSVINNKFETLVEKFKLILSNNNITESNVSAVGGPCLASGLANRIKSSVVIANENESVAKNIANIISTNYYNAEISNDVLGVEICAAIKNIYSMIIGASEGLSSDSVNEEVKSKYYLNTAASLMYKSISEMSYFTKSLIRGLIDKELVILNQVIPKPALENRFVMSFWLNIRDWYNNQKWLKKFLISLLILFWIFLLYAVVFLFLLPHLLLVH